MANDRVLIRCKGCGGWKMLMKHYPTNPGPMTWDNDVLNWLNTHAECHPRRFDWDLGGDPGFTLHTEADIGGDLDPDKHNERGPTPAEVEGSPFGVTRLRGGAARRFLEQVGLRKP